MGARGSRSSHLGIRLTSRKTEMRSRCLCSLCLCGCLNVGVHSVRGVPRNKPWTCGLTTGHYDVSRRFPTGSPSKIPFRRGVLRVPGVFPASASRDPPPGALQTSARTLLYPGSFGGKMNSPRRIKKSNMTVPTRAADVFGFRDQDI